jgi:hypothetical protein
VTHAATWSEVLTATQAMVERHYEQIEAVIRALASNPHLPVYIDEYNTETAVSEACCKNSPVFAPLWNDLFVADLFDSTRDSGSQHGGAAQDLPHLAYFTTTSPKTEDCLFGVWDAAIDCAAKPEGIAPYPQYWAYRLLGGPDYLGLTAGGFVAPGWSVQRTSGAGADLAVTPMTTAGNQYAAVRIVLQAPGLGAKKAEQYTLAGVPLATASPIQSQAVVLRPMPDGGLSATVTVPAYATIALATPVQTGR